MALSRLDFDVAECQRPGCTHRNKNKCELYFHGRCHPNAPVNLMYRKTTGTLVVTCARCRGPIAEITVAKGGAFR